MPIEKQFDHQYIEEQNVAERYLKGTLSGAAGPKTLETLEPEPPAAPLAILAKIPPERQKAVLALAVLLVAGIPAAFLSGVTAGLWNRSRDDAARATTSLVLEGTADPAVSSYAVAVTDSGDKLVWAASGILIPRGKAISIPMSFDRLPPGEYRVMLRGRRDDGSSTVVSSHVIRKP